MKDDAPKSLLTLYGIKNCDTIKKTRRWLEDRRIEYRFHDYRVDGLDEARLQDFIDRVGWQTLLNTRGATWRRLSEEQRKAIDNADAAKALMLQHPAIIKRPLLVSASGQALCGFSPDSYQTFIAEVK